MIESMAGQAPGGFSCEFGEPCSFSGGERRATAEPKRAKAHDYIIVEREPHTGKEKNGGVPASSQLQEINAGTNRKTGSGE